MSSINSRRDTSIPLAYIVVLSIRGMIFNFILAFQFFMYFITTSEGYQEFFKSLGREFTLFGTFSYLIAPVISVLMSVNRVAVVIKPMNMWFSNTKVFIYCGSLAIIVLISLIIPYLSPCYIIFMVNRLSHVAGCAPDRHPSLYASIPPIGKDVYFYVRMETIPVMNFFIYFVETKKTRAMVCRFLKRGTKQDLGVVSVSNHRTVTN
ncbi:unnamed protein product [Caenorhabditis nigoni]